MHVPRALTRFIPVSSSVVCTVIFLTRRRAISCHSTYLGLYEGIVRNAVPVFMSNAAFQEHVVPSLDRWRCSVLDVELTGRLGPILPYSAGLRGIGGCTDLVERLDLANAFAVFVDPDADECSRVRVSGPSRYLDGDIWCALDTSVDPQGTNDAWILNVPGVNIADPLDMGAQTRLLVDGITRDRGTAGTLFYFDQVDYPSRLGSQLVDVRSATMDLGVLGGGL